MKMKMNYELKLAPFSCTGYHLCFTIANLINFKSKFVKKMKLLWVYNWNSHNYFYIKNKIISSNCEKVGVLLSTFVCFDLFETRYLTPMFFLLK